ncbi:MAG: hypothetical protein R3B72_28345 [Polyangiaceae bacterium]
MGLGRWAFLVAATVLASTTGCGAAPRSPDQVERTAPPVAALQPVLETGSSPASPFDVRLLAGHARSALVLKAARLYALMGHELTTSLLKEAFRVDLGATRDCARPPLELVDRVVLSGTFPLGDSIVVAEMRDASPDVLLDCLATKVEGAHAGPLGGRPVLWLDERTIAVGDGAHVVVGPQAPVMAHLGTPLPPLVGPGQVAPIDGIPSELLPNDFGVAAEGDPAGVAEMLDAGSDVLFSAGHLGGSGGFFDIPAVSFALRESHGELIFRFDMDASRSQAQGGLEPSDLAVQLRRSAVRLGDELEATAKEAAGMLRIVDGAKLDVVGGHLRLELRTTDMPLVVTLFRRLIEKETGRHEETFDVEERPEPVEAIAEPVVEPAEEVVEE